MNNPIEQIKNGIQKRNWKEIEAAYFALTGENILGKNIDMDLELAKTNQLIKDVDELMNRYRHTPIMSGEKNKKQKSPPSPPIPPPNETITKGSAPSGHFGNKSVPITDEATEKEIQENEARKIKKEKRESPKTYQVKCSVCEKEFTSYTQPSGELGQRCSKCIRDSVKNDK